jgi:hypothetical protein
MYLDYEYSSNPQRLRDVHNIYHMVNSYPNSKNVVTKLADHKGTLIVHVNTTVYVDFGSFRKCLTDIWGLFGEPNIEFRDENDALIP